MIGLSLSAVDTLFFRDGTPFTSEGTGQSDPGGMFPPSPDTVSGALRAALARSNGWDGRPNTWPKSVLGDGADDLGRVSFEGPFVLKDGHLWVPVPRHVVGIIENGEWRPAALLGPGEGVICDLGDDIRLPDVVRNDQGVSPYDLVPGEDYWMSLDSLREVLWGGLPPESTVVPNQKLWRTERRIGLTRSQATRAAEEGMLYSALHIRLAPDVSLGVRVYGVPDDWRSPAGSLLPLGGEGRLVECSFWRDSELDALDMPLHEVASCGRAMVIALTPVILDASVYRGRAPLRELGGARVVSACLDRAMRLGGWDSLKKQPRPIRSVLPAGSVFFCEVAPGQPIEIDTSPGFPRIGERTAHGYGVVAIGVWPKG